MDDNHIEDMIGLESNSRMAYSRFYTSYNIRKVTQVPGKFDDWSSLQLPTGSILHTLNGFDTLEPKNDGLPDITLPLLHNEKNPLYLYMNTHLSTKSSMPLPVDETGTYRVNTLNAKISHFQQTHRNIHRILSERRISSVVGGLAWVDYSPMNILKILGVMHQYRKFDVLFRTILNTISTIGDERHHYIVLEQGSHVFSRAQLKRTYTELSSGTLAPFNHDPSVFPLIHLLGYVFGKTANAEVKPYKEDVRIFGKDAEFFSTMRSTSYLERLDSTLFKKINFILYHGNRAVVYNMADLDQFAEDTSFVQRFYRHLMGLRLGEETLPDHIDDDDFNTYVETKAGTDETSMVDSQPVSAVGGVTDTNTPVTVKESSSIAPKANEPKKFPLRKEPEIVHESQTGKTSPTKGSFEEKLRAHIEAPTQLISPLDDKKLTKREALLEGHLRVGLAGKTLGELAHASYSDKIPPKDLSFVTSAPEKSYRQSSLVALDKSYQEHSYHHDMARVLGSVAKHGYFITKIDEEHTHTEMDRISTYKVSMSDVEGRAHSLKFSIPTVNEDGVMRVSGVNYILTRQAANVPISKNGPNRINLSSYFNKLIVERIQSKRFNYSNEMAKLILTLRAQGLLNSVAGGAGDPTSRLPYDYSSIAMRFTEIQVKNYDFRFSSTGPSTSSFSKEDQNKISEYSRKYGLYVGGNPITSTLLFWDSLNKIHEVNWDKGIVNTWMSFGQFLVAQLGEEAVPDKTPIEWTQAQIINQVIPLVFILGYRLGLKKAFETIKLDYHFYPIGERVRLEMDDISIRFKDGTLVFNRYPLSRSLIAAGLAWVKLGDFNFNDMDVPTTYGPILALKNIPAGILKGVDTLFDFFIDPMTERVLEKMHEPTTFGPLLLRANVMLTDFYAKESSSVELQRFRRYERFNGFLYNEIYREMANHRNRFGQKKSFSINPEAVFQAIAQDATMSANDLINPIHEIKQTSNFTYTGSGGRSDNSFVLKDRIYPKDGVGVISDAVPDSGKVGITAYLSASPNINDVHGIPKPHQDGEILEPAQILSIGSMSMPCGTTDDGKRNSYTSIQLSHYVPNYTHGETLSIRTGYDAVVPHLGSKTFASSAQDDGVVEDVNEKFKVVTVRYADKLIPTSGVIKTPYLDGVINKFKQDHRFLGILVDEKTIGNYPVGSIYELTGSTNGKITDRIRCESVEFIPDKDVVRKYTPLVQDLIRGKSKALYYIRLSLVDRMSPGDIKRYSFADDYTSISGSYLLQKRYPNVVKGEKIKRGDILVYNSGFFVKDPVSKQVTFKHGVTATVVLMEQGANHEDACVVSRPFAERMEMTPCHQVEVITKPDAVLAAIVKINDHVETTDELCVISDDVLIQTGLNQNIENLDIMAKLSRQAPLAGYTGHIRKIKVLYGCPRDHLSESLKAVLKVYEKEVRQEFNATNNDPLKKVPDHPGYVKPGTKYLGMEFTDETVVLEFMIEEKLSVSEGDKLCFGLSSKSIVSHVSEQVHYTESGIPIDVVFSLTSVINRIVMSPFIIGIAERCMEKLRDNAVEAYFNED